MQQEQSKELLNEIYKEAKTGFDTLSVVENSIEGNADLHQAIHQQKHCYSDTIVQAATQLREMGVHAKGISQLDKMKMRAATKANIFMDNSPSHTAQMIIQGSTMGITTLQKTMNHCPQADEKAKKLSQELIQAEEAHIDAMKKFL